MLGGSEHGAEIVRLSEGTRVANDEPALETEFSTYLRAGVVGIERTHVRPVRNQGDFVGRNPHALEIGGEPRRVDDYQVGRAVEKPFESS
jgi:hypothetical protein